MTIRPGQKLPDVADELDGVVSTAPFIVREMLVTAEGSDADEAVNDLEQLIDRNFEEE